MITVQPRDLPGAAPKSKRRIVADPGSELALDNAKYRKETETLYLGGRGIEKLDPAQMATFATLAVLWLNDNKLSKLKSLDGNGRLTALFAQNNRIASLHAPSCSVGKLHFLETLLLENNRIADLTRTLEVLQTLPRLKTLNLFGNPVAEELHYRPTTVHRCRALLVFDQHPVVAAERTAAAELFSTARIHTKMAFGQRVLPWDKPVAQQRHTLSTTESWIGAENERVRARRRARSAREEHEAAYTAFLPMFEYATVHTTGAHAGVRVERVGGAPKGHTPTICVTFGPTDVAPSLAALARASGATRVFLQCALWDIPREPIRTRAVDLRALDAGAVDWQYAQIATAHGRGAQAYEALLAKAFTRRPTGREYVVALELFGVNDDGVESKRPLAVGELDLAALLRGEAADGSLSAAVPLTLCERGAPVCAHVRAGFEVAWSPYTTMPLRPALVERRDPRASGLTGDLTRDALAYLATVGGGAADGAVSRDLAGRVLEAVGCRASAEDVEALTRHLPEMLPAPQLASALGAARDALYASARQALAKHAAAADGESERPLDPDAMQAALRALRLHQDTDLPAAAPVARLRQRTATSHDVLAMTSLRTAADVARANGAFLPLVNLPRGEIALDERRFHAHELRKMGGTLAEAKRTILRMDSAPTLGTTRPL
jgi:hypothetical protein